MLDPVTNRAQRVPSEVPSSEQARKTPTREGTQEYRPPPVEELPRLFGRYELRVLLGRGGMGAVYLAHDPQLDRLVALKIPRSMGDEDDIWRRRFRDEARAAAILQHPNICPVFEVGEVDSQPYMTMAYIDGESVSAKLKREQALPIREAVQLVGTLAGAMAEAHARGIIHRDLKPANVMIDRRGQPMVMDFGLALRATANDDLRLTLSGVAVGTPAYMPPEQCGGDNATIGPPTDVYALGVILYELITGRVPFKATTFGQLVAQIHRDPPPFPSGLNPGIDSALEAVILTALEKEPEHRFATAAVLADALDVYLRGEHDPLVAKYGAAVTRAGHMTRPYVPGEDYPRAVVPARKPAPRRPWRSAVAVGMSGFVLLALLGGLIYQQTDYWPTRDRAEQSGGESGREGER
jgi:serine/threonine protein kinase